MSSSTIGPTSATATKFAAYAPALLESQASGVRPCSSPAPSAQMISPAPMKIVTYDRKASPSALGHDAGRCSAKNSRAGSPRAITSRIRKKTP